MKLTLAEAAMGTGAVLEAPPSVPHAGALIAQGYSIDSRTIAPGELFFAVRGERFDGHDFVAARGGARRHCRRGVARPRGHTARCGTVALPLLIAEDPLIALQALAAHVRRQWGKRVIAVTGSAGKDHHQGSDRRGARRAISTCSNRKGNLNNAYGLAAATSAPRARARICGSRDGHEPCRRNRRAGAHRHARLGRRDQRGHRPHGELRRRPGGHRAFEVRTGGLAARQWYCFSQLRRSVRLAVRPRFRAARRSTSAPVPAPIRRSWW